MEVEIGSEVESEGEYASHSKRVFWVRRRFVWVLLLSPANYQRAN